MLLNPTNRGILAAIVKWRQSELQARFFTANISCQEHTEASLHNRRYTYDPLGLFWMFSAEHQNTCTVYNENLYHTTFSHIK